MIHIAILAAAISLHSAACALHVSMVDGLLSSDDRDKYLRWMWPLYFYCAAVGFPFRRVMAT